MRLGPKGEIIAATGFDGTEYTPRYADRTSIFLGDMSQEDIRVRKIVKAREEAIARQNAAALATKRMIERQKMLTQDRLNQQLQAREAIGNRIQEVARARGYEAARKHATHADYHPWIGSSFAGFGQEGEVRINPDQAQDIEIVDANIPSVQEYGINNWMEDPEAIKERVSEAETGYTQGEVQLATMVDYARSPEESVVGMPIASMIADEIKAAESVIDPLSKTVAAQTGAAPNMVKWGIYALAAYLILR